MVAPAALAGRRSTLATMAAVAGGVLAVLLASGRPPGTGLLYALGAVVAIAALWDVRVAVLALIASGPLELAVDLGLGEALTLGKLTGALAFASFAFDAVRTRRVVRLDRTHVALLLLLAIALMSAPGARSPGEALSTSVRYASFVGLYVVLTQFRGEHPLKRRLVWTLTLASAVLSLHSLSNFISGDSPLARPWYGDPNDFAFIVATTLPLSFWLFTQSSARSRLLAAGCIATMAAGVVLSLSRGALLGLAVGTVWHAFTERRHLPALLAGGAVALAAALLVANANTDHLARGLDSKSRIAQENVESRLDAWRVAAELAAEHPVLGVGPGNFGHYYFERSGRPPGTFGLRVVHDTYLDIAAELGLTGLVLFLFFLGTVFWRATLAIRRAQGPPGFAAATRTALVVAMVGGITLSEQYFAPFWVLGALATLVWADPVREPSRPDLVPA